MPKMALAKKKPITGIRNSCIGRLKYCGKATMPAVQNSAIRVKIRCSASANQLNQPVRKWKRWPALSGPFCVIQFQRPLRICIAPNAQR
ncbi:hypothetical protein RLIN73S_07514 [Rhodanobacter lindaniclasticus]